MESYTRFVSQIESDNYNACKKHAKLFGVNPEYAEENGIDCEHLSCKIGCLFFK